ncbi:hypothetical protein ACIBI4_19200 [Streptomyces sp. NPDC050418]|uniref:hypothetical protein n=1 Tax=Streptomyces sp. NPDC050418 TaxID=3365612 RepID=UPI00379D3786
MSLSFAFELVRRGYDRAEVDAVISTLVAERERALAELVALREKVGKLFPQEPLPDAADLSFPPSPEGVPTQGLTIVRRGYDREQVDTSIGRLVTDRDRARAQAAALKQRYALS